MPDFVLGLASPESGIAYLEVAVESMAKSLAATTVFVAHKVSDETDEVRVLAAISDGERREPFSYALHEQPCLIPYDGQPTLIPCDIGDQFPAKGEAGYQSFVGVPLRAGSGSVIGHIAIYDRSELIADGTVELGLVQAFASRMACELERHLEHEKLRRTADTCSMTGLLNRRGFDSKAHVLIDSARRSGSDLTVVAFDLDRLKAVNDTHGHAVGDRLITTFASCLGAVFHRSTDLVARVGGDEFVVVAAATSKHEALRLAEEGRLLFEAAPVDVGSETISGTCSFGAASLDEAGDLGELLEQADAALYESKATRNERRGD